MREIEDPIQKENENLYNDNDEKNGVIVKLYRKQRLPNQIAMRFLMTLFKKTYSFYYTILIVKKYRSQ